MTESDGKSEEAKDRDYKIHNETFESEQSSVKTCNLFFSKCDIFNVKRCRISNSGSR